MQLSFLWDPLKNCFDFFFPIQVDCPCPRFSFRATRFCSSESCCRKPTRSRRNTSEVWSWHPNPRKENKFVCAQHLFSLSIFSEYSIVTVPGTMKVRHFTFMGGPRKDLQSGYFKGIGKLIKAMYVRSRRECYVLLSRACAIFTN